MIEEIRQKFTDEITNDWGGKAYTDVMKGVDVTLAKYKFIDGTKMAAAAARNGGYMANWIATHTGRFKAIISHEESGTKRQMYGTEELWFEEHDMLGTPWTAPENYRSGRRLAAFTQRSWESTKHQHW